MGSGCRTGRPTDADCRIFPDCLPITLHRDEPQNPMATTRSGRGKPSHAGTREGRIDENENRLWTGRLSHRHHARRMLREPGDRPWTESGPDTRHRTGGRRANRVSRQPSFSRRPRSLPRTGLPVSQRRRKWGCLPRTWPPPQRQFVPDLSKRLRRRADLASDASALVCLQAAARSGLSTGQHTGAHRAVSLLQRQRSVRLLPEVGSEPTTSRPGNPGMHVPGFLLISASWAMLSASAPQWLAGCNAAGPPATCRLAPPAVVAPIDSRSRPAGARAPVQVCSS